MEAKDTPADMWNVAFLVKDFPEALRTVGPAHFMSTIDEHFLEGLKKLPRKEAAILNFIAHHSAKQFIWVGFKVDAPDKLSALAEAYHRMEGLIDGASFWGHNDTPAISETAWVGLADDPDMSLVVFRRQLWIEMVTAPNESALLWETRNKELRARVNRFFSLAIEQHTRSGVPLARQIRHSMRMFRHGKQSGSWGVEFICKFCALEGLVCGEERHGKHEKIKTRLSALFRDNSTEFTRRCTKLWEFRSDAVHTAKAFDAGSLNEGASLGIHIEQIEHLFVGVLVFALERLPTTETVADLWSGLGGYQLPDFARQNRPSDLPKYAAPNMEVSTGVRMGDGGNLFRKFIEMGRARYDAAYQEKA